MKHLLPETKRRSPKQGSSLFFRGEIMTNDAAVQALLDYLNESDEPEIYWPRHHFE